MSMPTTFACTHCGQTFPIASLTQGHIESVHAEVARAAVTAIDNDEQAPLKHTLPFHSTNR